MDDKNKYKSALKVNEGVEQPPIVNPNIRRFKKKRKLTAKEYIGGILKGDMSVLSMAITLIESSLPAHKELAEEIIEGCLPHSGNSIRIGITGVPGVGKSTFIEALGMDIINKGHKLAVLAIDPSSERTKGSILGDKTRMEELSVNDNAFIRPSPSAGSLGGVARKTRESVILCEAAGFDIIFIETVGVGQSETAVHSMVDFFLLLMLAGAGDELQGIKRGIMEMADAIAITKCDGSNIDKANMARVEYQNALHLFPPQPSGWTPIVKTCSSVTKDGVPDVWQTVLDYKALVTENKFMENRRNEQAKYWMYETINEQLRNSFYQDDDVKQKLEQFEKDVISNKMSSFNAAHVLLNQYINKCK
ncbi:MAG: methylmalonyl Co-A mutase-associated GTPase MeaB [Bacteroidales bacterium]|jgi:LAO/AO transport system kinase|nr:methylmalonyl Co-A mutase-associated GTPase MeaB [Bacteroidales bacterium]